MELHEVIIQALREKKNLSLQDLLSEVKAVKTNCTNDQILEMIKRMKGKSIVRLFNAKKKDYLYCINVSEVTAIPLRKPVIKSSSCEVIARQILKGANIEEAAAQFTCRPLTIIRKVQQYCMTRDPELYQACIDGNRKTADINVLRQNFVQFIE